MSACGIEPLRLLFWIRTLASEMQLESENGSVLVSLLLKRMSLTSFCPLHTFTGIGPWSEFVDTSSFVSNPLEPSFAGSVPLSELLNTKSVSSFGSSPIPCGISPVSLFTIRLRTFSSFSIVISVGIDPVSSLSDKSSAFRDFNFPKVDGISPLRRFLKSSSVSSMVKFPSSGITWPVMLVDEMSRYLRLGRVVSSIGIVPENGLYPISKCCSSVNRPS